MFALPFVTIKISVKSPGLLQSALAKTQLIIPVNGRLLRSNLKENQKLRRGDTLLIIDATVPQQQDALLQARSIQIGQSLQDISKLLSADDFSTADLQTGQYNASWQQYVQEAENARHAKDQTERIFKRNERLYQNKVLTASEFEKYKYEYEQAVLAYLVLTKRYRSQWQVEANQFRSELRQIYSQKTEVVDQKKLYTLIVPVNGSLQNFSGLQPGAYVFANQKVGEISADTSLTAFCFIKPSDIGLIYNGQPVNFQIDAFNYNQWGLLKGKVLEISDDIVVFNNNQPVFKVRCSLDKNYLQLKNGYRGKLLKGMNFTARFFVAERSLYQLAYDKVDDWVNPNIISSNN